MENHVIWVPTAHWVVMFEPTDESLFHVSISAFLELRAGGKSGGCHGPFQN